MSCECCRQLMTIRDTVYCGELKKFPRAMADYGGRLGIRASKGTHFLYYENSDNVFWTEIEIQDSWPINYCPMCGEKLPSAKVVDQ